LLLLRLGGLQGTRKVSCAFEEFWVGGWCVCALLVGLMFLWVVLGFGWVHSKNVLENLFLFYGLCMLANVCAVYL
jgi:hypothetical protein